MSRVGKKPLEIPPGVELRSEGNLVVVKGPKGELRREINPALKIEREGNLVRVIRTSDASPYRALHGLTRTLLANMLTGAAIGFSKTLELVGVGYRAAKQGNKLVLSVGYSRPVEIIPEEGLEFEVPAPNRVVIKGADKEKVGNFAARVRAVRPPEPYKGKGIRYAEEYVRTKAGKTGAGKAGKGKKK